MNSSLRDIASLVQGVVLGDDSIKVIRLSTLDDIQPGALIFVDSDSSLKIAEASSAACILVNRSITQSNKPLIQVPHAFKAFIQLLNHFHAPVNPTCGIHPSAVVADNVDIGEGVYVGPYVVIEAGTSIGDNCILKSHIHIGSNVTIGSNTTIHSQVTVYDNCQIGSKVIIHASTVIGSDGFGYINVDGKHLKVPHVGHVVIHDEVEIGANTAIDRATMGATVIGEGTKIDNLVQVAHSVQLGKHNILCGFTGIAGSTTSGDNVIFAANVGVSDHVKIDAGVILGARTGVPPNKHLKAGNIYLGNPARPRELALKHELAANRVPLIQKNIKTLANRLDQLEKQLAEQEINYT
ncbi:MAG: UDP-3-O-(3-hydroxymyristoyl)glucosamine N-acyltransferase [Legionella sp.]|nr:UDP-3-O-(3-hydroxymyristoyl)glucosamine N-acyltransferase [Legionella sp.]